MGAFTHCLLNIRGTQLTTPVNSACVLPFRVAKAKANAKVEVDGRGGVF